MRDFVAVARGDKTEFRVWHPRHVRPTKQWLITPAPAIGYASGRRSQERHACLLVLEEIWLEPLGAISPESLEREGFASLAEFREYWADRTVRSGGWRPLDKVRAHRVRPGSPQECGEMLFDRLYGLPLVKLPELGVVVHGDVA